jgi:hypothetical protein
MVQSDIDTAQRIVRLETKLDFLIDRIDKLPPSPVCLARHREIEDRLDDMDKWRNRVVGVVLMFNIVIVVFMDKIRNFFTSP